MLKVKAFTLIEILITIAIISLVMVGISSLSGNQVNKIKEKIIKEEFVSTYNAALLNSIWSSNIPWQSTKNTLVIYDGEVATTGFSARPSGSSEYRIIRNRLPWSATIVFDNYGLWCAIDGQTGLQNVDFDLVLNTINQPTISCFTVDLGTCKLLERKC